MKYTVVRDEDFEEVDADFFTIESGGTLVLWRKSGAATNLALRAYAAGTWVRIDES